MGRAVRWRRGVATLPASHVAQYPFSGPLDGGKASGGGGRCGKHLNHFLGLPCAAGEGVGLPVSPEPFPCQAVPSLGLSGVGGVAPALPVRYLRTTTFPIARPFGGLCLRGGLLVACPWLLPSGYRLLIFRWGGVAVAGAWSPSGGFLGGAAASRARVFLYRD